MSPRFVIDVVAADGAWSLTGTIDDRNVSFIQHVEREQNALARGDALAAWNLGTLLGDGEWHRRAIALGFDVVDPAGA